MQTGGAALGLSGLGTKRRQWKPGPRLLREENEGAGALFVLWCGD